MARDPRKPGRLAVRRIASVPLACVRHSRSPKPRVTVSYSRQTHAERSVLHRPLPADAFERSLNDPSGAELGAKHFEATALDKERTQRLGVAQVESEGVDRRRDTPRWSSGHHRFGDWNRKKAVRRGSAVQYPVLAADFGMGGRWSR